MVVPTVARKRPILAGLDIGTQRVSLLIGERVSGGIEVLGVGTAPSRGIKAGRVSELEKTTQPISVALAEAEEMAGCQVHQVTVSVSGDHIHGTNSHGVVAIDNGEVSARAARKVIEAAQAVPLPVDQKILHLICREYAVDGQREVRDPVGLSGVRLEANLHIISGCESALGNIMKVCNKAGLSVDDFIASSLAAGEAVLDAEHDEKELGVAVVDIGAGTCDIAVYVGGSVVHSAVIPMAGLYLTRDLAHCLETSMSEAESLKLHHGIAVARTVDRTYSVEVSGVGGREYRLVGCRMVAEIIQARLEEIFEAIGDSILRSGYGEMLTSGVVLTGGTALMPEIANLASTVLQMPVRVGEPTALEGLVGEVDDPSWSACVGLLRGLAHTDMAEPWRPGLGARLLPQWVWRKWREFR